MDTKPKKAKYHPKPDVDLTTYRPHVDARDFVIAPLSVAKLDEFRARREHHLADICKMWRAEWSRQSRTLQKVWELYFDDAGKDEVIYGAGHYPDDLSSDVFALYREKRDDAADTIIATPDWVEGVWLKPRRSGEADGADESIRTVIMSDEWSDFLMFSERARRRYNAVYQGDAGLLDEGADYDAGEFYELDDEVEPPPPLIVPGLLPFGISYWHGDEGRGKSVLARKVALIVSDVNGAQYDGQPVQHGPVLYVSLDPNARRRDIAPRIIAARTAYGLKSSGRLLIKDDFLHLNNPESVREFKSRRKDAVPFKLVIVDSLMMALEGGFTQRAVLASIDGAAQLLRDDFADAVVILTHDLKDGSDMLGTVLQRPSSGAVVKLSIAGAIGKQRVKVAVERLKGMTPPEPKVYALKIGADDMGAWLLPEDEPSADEPRTIRVKPKAGRPQPVTEAKHTDCARHEVMTPGQAYTGGELAKLWDVSDNTAWRIYRRLEAAGLVQVKGVAPHFKMTRLG
jgi:hypothetical protein